MLWFFPKKYFDAEFSKKTIFASKTQGQNILMQDFYP
jgi:hypothetical protein